MISTESSEFFRGVVDVDLSVVTTSRGPNNNTKLVSRHPVFVDLKAQATGMVEQTNEPPNDTQVNNYHRIRPLLFPTLVF